MSEFTDLLRREADMLPFPWGVAPGRYRVAADTIDRLTRERDAALAVIERVRALADDDGDRSSCDECRPCVDGRRLICDYHWGRKVLADYILAALDGEDERG